MAIDDKALEKKLLTKLRGLQCKEVDALAPTTLRHHLSDLLSEMQWVLKEFDQAKDDKQGPEGYKLPVWPPKRPPTK